MGLKISYAVHFSTETGNGNFMLESTCVAEACAEACKLASALGVITKITVREATNVNS